MTVLHVAGVGKMGLPMAGHFHAGGHAVTVSEWAVMGGLARRDDAAG